MTKTDFDAKLSSFNKKINSNKIKHLLVENELKKLKTFNLSYFIGKSHFEEVGTQNYLVFQPLNKYFKIIANKNIFRRGNLEDYQTKLLGLLLLLIINLTPQLSYFSDTTRVEFKGSCLNQDKITFNHRNIVNIYIAYELNKLYSKTTLTLVNCLFGAVSFGRNEIIFGVDMSLSVHVDNKGKDILILGKGPTQGLGEHSLTAEKMYSVNFTDNGDKYCLSLHYNGANSYLFVNGVEIIKFKAKDSNILATPLCLGNISTDWSVDNMKDAGLNGYVYDFSVDYDATAVDDIKDIHKYLMKKNNIA